MMRKLKTFFLNIKLRNKILITTMSILLITVSIFGYLFFIRTSALLEDKTVQSTEKSLNQAVEFVNYRMNNAKDASSLIYLDPMVKDLISKMSEESELYKKFEYYSDLNDILININTGRDLYNIRLYLNDDFFTSVSGSKIINESKILNEPWYKQVRLDNSGIVWIPTYEYDFGFPREKQNVISIARSIYSREGDYKYLGIIIVDILEKSFYDIIKDIDITKSGGVYLLDQNNVILSSDNKQEIGTSFTKKYNMEDAAPVLEGNYRLIAGKEEALYFSKNIPNMEWRLVAVVPRKEIIQDTRGILEYMILLLLFLTVIAVIISYKVSVNVTRRIDILSKNMRKIQDDDWDVDVGIVYDDEIGDLQRSFSYMIHNMKTLISEKYKSEIRIKKADLRTLQAQINPHFLYNILDMISWMAMKYQAEDITYIVSRLAKFFRISLSSGREMVSIRDEMEHVKLYIDIQRKRFDDAIEMRFDLDENVMNCETVKLILQPLVENAILHGIMESDRKSGMIQIKSAQEGEDVLIEIIDNGIGMSEEQIRNIENHESRVGYGIKNVNQRIKLKYGNQYGLSYQSTLQVGTKVTIRFPAIEM